MRTQFSCNSGLAAASLRGSLLAVAALLTALGPLTAAWALPRPDFVLPGPAASAELGWGDFESTVDTALAANLHSDEDEFDSAAAGLTVTGPFAAADGASGGMVLSWTVASRDPAYLVSVASLFSNQVGSGSRIAGNEIFGVQADFGVVPGGNLSVFETGAVDVISWDFLQFSCALLALRMEDYLRLNDALGPGGPDASAPPPSIGQPPVAVPEPATFLLMSQGILVLALLGSRRSRS
jgi:hypothetical protein